MENMDKKTYEPPIVEVIEFSTKDTIAASGAKGAAYWEEI